MAQYLVSLSALLLAGQVLWQVYFVQTNVCTVRDELKLNPTDVYWYKSATP